MKTIRDLRKMVNELEERCFRYWEPVHSLFLNPVEVRIVSGLLKDYGDVVWRFSPLATFSEYSILSMTPKDVPIHEEGYITIAIDDTESNLSHPDILGALLSYHYKRGEIGDILNWKGRWYINLTKESFEREGLFFSRIKNTNVTYKPSNIPEEIEQSVMKKEERFIVSSLRLDNFIKEVYGLKRDDCQKIIRNNDVKVNYKVENRPGKLLKAEDLISVRRQGRSELVSVLNKTRKDRLVIVVNRWEHKR